MPRNGSGVYSLPAGTAATTLTTIESAKYNAFIADVEQDLNTDRPVAAGGTGASTESGARDNLGVYGKTLRITTTSRSAGASDNNQLIEFTGAGTLSTDPAATLGDGWMCYVYAAGGDVTIDPNSTETVNGETTITLRQGWSGILRVNNGNFIFQFMRLKDDTPQVDMRAVVNAGSIPHSTMTTLTTLTDDSTGDIGNSSFASGVFTVGTGDAGLYMATLQYAPIVGATDYTVVSCQIVPSDASPTAITNIRTSAGGILWTNAIWVGRLADADTLTFQALQANSAAATRSNNAGTHCTVTRLGG